MVFLVNAGAGFIYSGLPPHIFTPMPGVHMSLHLTADSKLEQQKEEARDRLKKLPGI